MLRPKTKVVDIKTRKPIFTKTIVTRFAFYDLADAVGKNIEELGLSPDKLKKSLEILEDIKFCASLNKEVRDSYYPQLEELMYELYERVHT